MSTVHGALHMPDLSAAAPAAPVAPAAPATPAAPAAPAPCCCPPTLKIRALIQIMLQTRAIAAGAASYNSKILVAPRS